MTLDIFYNENSGYDVLTDNNLNISSDIFKSDLQFDKIIKQDNFLKITNKTRTEKVTGF